MKTISVLLLMFVSVSGFSQDYDDEYEKIIKKAEKVASEDGQKVLETGRRMTLDSALILPGGCWDYANAVYLRAGYSWGQREEVYKSVKAGPYADVSKITKGDWLYYVNHSYGNIEHSAIFVDWLDYENKVGLMLSYGGENRHEPARYLPYDLSSVYGITRPNAKTNEKKSSTKTNVVSDKNTTIKANVKDSSKTVSTKAISGVTSNGMKVEAFKFGAGINQMEIVGEGTTFSGNAGKVYCWMRVSGGQGRFVKLKWYHNGAFIGDVQLDIKYNPMRTYAYRTVTGRQGTWTVEVVDAAGTILHSANFTVK
ncbi:DUF2914 domain-containing protein [bacterium]|nr:DUF2914 domain-containing protein [bacterium]